jgi:cyclopropane fatty-acyl-phospholipid synthase-like methyltransferase
MKVKTCLAYLELLAPRLPEGLPSRELLDIGCAHGFMLRAAKQKGFRASGIEISPATLTAREQGFTVYDRPLADLNLPADTFDPITAIDVIEHVLDIKGS